MISNEMLEASVASIRTNLTDLKADVRAVAAETKSEIKTAVARMDDQFRELRQDIRELRDENRTLRDKLNANYSSLDKRIDTTRASLCEKFDGSTAR